MAFRRHTVRMIAADHAAAFRSSTGRGRCIRFRIKISSPFGSLKINGDFVYIFIDLLFSCWEHTPQHAPESKGGREPEQLAQGICLQADIDIADQHASLD